MKTLRQRAEPAHPFHGEPRNRILAALPPGELERIRPHLGIVSIPRRFVLEDFDQAADRVYFLQSGLAGLQVHTGRDDPVEVGLVGRLGVIGASAALGTTHASVRVVMQVAGEALTLQPKHFQAAMARSPALLQLLLNDMQAMSMQSAQLVLCNARHETEQRVARWLLLAHDQLGADRIPVTHDTLGSNLGVRRASVTNSLNVLERSGTLRTERACITILDRPRLLERSCDCYRTISSEYERLTR